MAAAMDELPGEAHLTLVRELRNRFITQCIDANPGKYDPRDVARARESDTWLMHFLIHQKDDVANAVKMMDAVLSWRKTFGVNDIHEDSVAFDLRAKGALFFHNKNKSGNDILHFKIKLNRKGDAEAMKQTRMVIAYMLDQYQRRNPLQKIVALLDMTDVGLANVDLELTKFLVTCFTTYFPGMLDYLLVYDMPWIVNAIWAIIKQLLSEEEQKHVIFCKKNTIQQYIDRNQLFPHMGGTDTFRFVYTRFFEPEEQEGGDFQETENNDDDDNDNNDDTAQTTDNAQENSNLKTDAQVPTATSSDIQSTGDGSWQLVEPADDLPNDITDSADQGVTKGSKKKVNWAENPEVKEFAPPSPSEPSTSTIGTSQSPTASMNQSRVANGLNSYKSTYKITVVPTSELQFTRPGINHDAPCSIKLTNDNPVALAYKVKTTDPKNYRVKQGRGILQPTHSETINIVLLAGKEIKRDKFLVLSTQLDSADVTQSELAAFWKTINRQKVHEHKLRCHEAALEIAGSANKIPLNTTLSNESTAFTSIIPDQSVAESPTNASVDIIHNQIKSELEYIKRLLVVVLSLLVLLIAAIIFK